MLDWLGNLLSQFWEKFIFLWIIKEYEEGVLLRFGKFRKVLKKGLHFKIPFADEILSTPVVPTTMPLGAQSLTTKDDKTVVVKGIIKYEIDDIKVFLLEVYDATSALDDMTRAIIKTAITDRTWVELSTNGNEIDKEITAKARSEASKWGIKIIKVTLTDLGKIRSYRLFTDSNHVI